MTEENRNPFLEYDDPYTGYNEKIQELKNKPETVEIDKLCYLTFRTEEGKQFLEMVKDQYLIPGFVHPNTPNPGDAALYYEGFKQGFRMILNSINAHEQRIKAEGGL